MQRDPRAYLWDARRAAELILGFVEHKGLSRVRSQPTPPLRRRAPVRDHRRSVEPVVAGRPGLAACVPDLAELVGFRNLLIHGYALADDAIVWEAVTTELPVLRQRLNELLAEN